MSDTTKTILLIVIALVVIGLIIWLYTSSRRKEVEARRAHAAELRSRVEQTLPTVQDHVDRASVTEQIAADARAEAEAKAAEARRLAAEAEEHRRAAESVREQHERLAREADRIDPDVPTDEEGFRVDDTGHRLDRTDRTDRTDGGGDVPATSTAAADRSAGRDEERLEGAPGGPAVVAGAGSSAAAATAATATAGAGALGVGAMGVGAMGTGAAGSGAPLGRDEDDEPDLADADNPFETSTASEAVPGEPEPETRSSQPDWRYAPGSGSAGESVQEPVQESVQGSVRESEAAPLGTGEEAEQPGTPERVDRRASVAPTEPNDEEGAYPMNDDVSHDTQPDTEPTTQPDTEAADVTAAASTRTESTGEGGPGPATDTEYRFSSADDQDEARVSVPALEDRDEVIADGGTPADDPGDHRGQPWSTSPGAPGPESEDGQPGEGYGEDAALGARTDPETDVRVGDPSPGTGRHAGEDSGEDSSEDASHGDGGAGPDSTTGTAPRDATAPAPEDLPSSDDDDGHTVDNPGPIEHSADAPLLDDAAGTDEGDWSDQDTLASGATGATGATGTTGATGGGAVDQSPDEVLSDPGSEETDTDVVQGRAATDTAPARHADSADLLGDMSDTDRTVREGRGDAESPRSAAGDPSGRRISEFDEVTDGGFGIGSAAPIADGAQPLGHAVKARRDGNTFLAPGAPGYDEAEPDVWFYTEEAARRAGFSPEGGE